MHLRQPLARLAAAMVMLLTTGMSARAQEISSDSARRLAAPHAGSIDSVRKARGSAVLLVLLQQDGRTTRAGAFPLLDERVGNFESVTNCFPDVTLNAIDWTMIFKLDGSGTRLRKEWTYLLVAKTKASPARVAAAPGPLCGRR